MDYSVTLNLPRTDFPMRANLPQREPEILRRWEEMQIYRLVQAKNAGKPLFVLHDGPPYANGDIHLGTTLNKVLKDIVVKFHSMTGYDAPFVPGWDTHGLPIEQQAIKNWGLDRHTADPVEFRRRCREYALHYVNVQREEFQRLGVRGDWENPYLTLTPDFEAAQVGVFGVMAEKGYIYKGLKPVYWCADCETALAEAEVEYADHRSPSVYVRFPVRDAKGLFPETNAYVVIWTTTPWTLPANVAIAVHPDFSYVLVEVEGERLVMAGELYRRVLEAAGLPQGKVVQRFSGRQLEGVVCRNPLLERDSLVILGEHVTLEQGSGCVHTAPGHGLEDYEVGRRYNLPIISPLDDRGRFTAEIPFLEGLETGDANQRIMQALHENGALLRREEITHQYPHCWRCKHPVLFRATEQWFASIDGFREAALAAIRQVKWIPAWGEERIHSMVAERSDWCISRQRLWGVPIPVFYCESCGEGIINRETIQHVQKLFAEHGSDIWFARPAADLVPPGLTCPRCGHGEFRKESDIMDVWFDSGSSHVAVLEGRPGLRWPADLYLEGSDQHRGWFNSSLSTAVAVRGSAPYRAVLTHGYVVDEQGRKMSKSLGNGIDPMEEVERLGADILRLWVASSDYRKDVAASPNIMKQMSDAYRKIRNTCRFLLGNLYDFNPATDSVPYAELPELDRWALLQLARLVQRVTEAYRQYEFHLVSHAVHTFCVLDMSAFYLDILKDRLYCEPAASRQRRAAQTVLYETITTLVRLLAPILAFTSEEIWQHLPAGEEQPASVQLATWPQVREEYLDARLEERWNRVRRVREEVSVALERARQQKAIGSSLEARVDLYPDEEVYRWLQPLAAQLPAVFITSAVTVHEPGAEVPEGGQRAAELPLWVLVRPAEGEKCQRCWNYHPDVGRDPAHPDICPRCAGVLEAGGR